MPRRKAEPPPHPPHRERVYPPPLPDEQSRNLVRTLYVGGWTQAAISKVIGCDEKTLRYHYRGELDLGKAKTDALVTQSILHMALGGTGSKDQPYDWRKASPSMASFYAKTRMGWKDESLVKHSGAVGTYDLSKLTDDEVKHIDDLLSRATISGVAGYDGEDGTGEA